MNKKYNKPKKFPPINKIKLKIIFCCKKRKIWREA